MISRQGGEDGQNGRGENGRAEETRGAHQRGDDAAKDLRRDESVEECTQDQSLFFGIPIELLLLTRQNETKQLNNV